MIKEHAFIESEISEFHVCEKCGCMKNKISPFINGFKPLWRDTHDSSISQYALEDCDEEMLFLVLSE